MGRGTTPVPWPSPQAPPAEALLGAPPQAPTPQGPGPVGDSSRDAVMQNGCDLQCVSANAGVPVTVRVCTRPCPWVRGRVGVWAYVGVLGRVPRDM